MSDSMTDNLSDGLTPTEAAARLGLSERTIWRRIKAGKLHTKHTIDGVRVVLPDSLSDASVSVSDTMTDKPVSTSDSVSNSASEAIQALAETIEHLREDHRAEVDRLERDKEALRQAAEH